jgi:hypothetical protein
MTSLAVAIPVLKMRTILIVDKGRPWSVIEHMLLEALAKHPQSAEALANSAEISRRVVVEAIVRMMRSGWIELSDSAEAIIFGCTKSGRRAAGSSELPSLLERRRRSVQYIVDLVTGEIFKNRDWYLRVEGDVREREKKEPVLWLKPRALKTLVNPKELVDLLLEEDETFVDAETAGAVRRCALVTLADGAVRGFPEGRELTLLRNEILTAAQEQFAAALALPALTALPPETSGRGESELREREIYFSAKDLLLDGATHADYFRTVLAKAKSTIIIHSTFLSADKVNQWWPGFEAALKRGVAVHIFWGQTVDREEARSSQRSISILREDPKIQKWGDSFVLHPFSTGSHSKLLIADTDRGRFTACIGSCNWLSSSFKSFEASVILRDPDIVSDVLKFVCSLAMLHDGIWTNLAGEFVSLAQRVKGQPRPASKNARAAIVIGAQHEGFVLRARDEATKRIVVTSHRLGAVASPAVVAPLAAAVRNRSISAEIVYGRRTLPVRRGDETALSIDAEEEGVGLTLVERPRVHAKALAWDDDDLLVSSLNWLSADPTELESLKEIGVWIHGVNVGKQFVDQFTASRESLAREEQ